MYEYEKEKKWVFTEKGSRQFLRIRDYVNRILDEAGAITMGKATAKETGGNWEQMACVDRMLELGELREVSNPKCFAQDRIFVKPVR